jgi:hypothetical protein
VTEFRAPRVELLGAQQTAAVLVAASRSMITSKTKPGRMLADR